MPYAIRIHERCPNCGEDLAKWDPPEDEPPAPAEGLNEILSDLINLAYEAMGDANRDGGEYDRDAELANARAALEGADR